MKKKASGTHSALILLLSIRILGQLTMFGDEFLLNVVLGILLILYSAALYEIIHWRKFGSMLASYIAIIDILSTAFVGNGAVIFGALAFDLALLYLASREYQKIAAMPADAKNSRK